MTIPGIGALGATALLAAVGSGRQFQKVRDDRVPSGGVGPEV
nr:hypothetical protein [Sinorhizobium meliloti]